MAAARSIRQAYDARLAGVGLNLSQASLLAYIAESGPRPQARLAEALDLGRAATGSLVDGLEARGYVERRADADDRRVWVVALTETGARTAAEVEAIDLALREQLRRGITKAERQQLAHLILKLQANLAAPTD